MSAPALNARPPAPRRTTTRSRRLRPETIADDAARRAGGRGTAARDRPAGPQQDVDAAQPTTTDRIERPVVQTGVRHVVGRERFGERTRQKEKGMPIARPFARTALLLLLIGVLVFPPWVGLIDAASHREAPLIAMDPAADITDTFFFRSYEPGKDDKIVLI